MDHEHCRDTTICVSSAAVAAGAVETRELVPNSDSHNSISEAAMLTDGPSRTAHLDPNKGTRMI